MLYKTKPNKSVQGELKEPIDIEVQELAYSLAKGYNCRPSASIFKWNTDKGEYEKTFISQQLFMIDIDNDSGSILKPLEAIKKAKDRNIYPCFIYPTHSYTEAKPKYRIAFLISRPITNVGQREKLQTVFQEIYGIEADSKCTDAFRIFYGGHSGKLLYSDFNAINDTDVLLMKRIEEKQISTKTKKLPKQFKAPKGSSSLKNVELIKKRNARALKNILANDKHIVFDTRKELFNYIYHEIDLAELLGVQEKEMFNCLFHEDKNASANVYVAQYGTWQYHCFGCDLKMNTKQVLETLADFKSEYQAINFIKEVYNLEVKETEWAKEQAENIDRILDCITRTDDKGFSELCPIADKNTRFAKQIFTSMLVQAKSTIYPDRSTNGNILFYMSLNQIAEMSGKSSHSGKQREKVNKYIKMLACHNMIEIVPDEEIPTAFLNKALRDRKNNKGKHTQFYSIPSWVYSRLLEIEEAGKIWKQNGIVLDSINYESIYRTYGYDTAKKLFPQSCKYIQADGTTKQRATTKNQDKQHEIIQEIIIGFIQANGYCLEKHIIQVLNINEKIAKQRIKTSLPDILACNNLKQTYCNKDLKAKYMLPDSISDRYHHPKIIIQCD